MIRKHKGSFTTFRYLYTDEVELDSETVLPTLYVAKKYLVCHLVKKCVEYLENTLNAQNVCILLSQSRLFEEDELMLRYVINFLILWSLYVIYVFRINLHVWNSAEKPDLKFSLHIFLFCQFLVSARQNLAVFYTLDLL